MKKNTKKCLVPLWRNLTFVACWQIRINEYMYIYCQVHGRAVTYACKYVHMGTYTCHWGLPYIYIRVCVYIYAYLYWQVCGQAFTYIYMYTYKYLHVLTSKQLRVCICVCIHTNVYILTLTSVELRFTCLYV